MQLSEIWVVWDVEKDGPAMSEDVGTSGVDSYLFCMSEDDCTDQCDIQYELYGIECSPRRFVVRRDDNSGSLADCNEERPVR